MNLHAMTLRLTLVVLGVLGFAGHAQALSLVGFSNPTTIIQIGGSANITLLLDQAAQSDTNIHLAASNPAVISIPTSILIPQGNSNASFSAAAVGLGSSTIEASFLGNSVSTLVNVTAAAVPEPAAYLLFAGGLLLLRF